MRRFRMLTRIFIEAGLGLLHSRWLNFVIISILVSALIIFGLMLTISVSFKNIANSLGSKTEFSVHIKDTSNMDSIIQRINSIKEIRQIRVSSKEQNWKRLLKHLDMQIDDSFNKLPNTLVINIDNSNNIMPVINKIKQIVGEDLEEIEHLPEIVRKLQSVKNILIFFGILISMLLGIATFVINFNTIELVIRSRKQELDLLNFMGVTEWYIKGPFIVQGLFYGICSSAVSCALLSMVYQLIRNNKDAANILSFLMPKSSIFWQIICLLFLTGVVFSCFSSYWVTERKIRLNS